MSAQQTKESFHSKWTNNVDLAFQETLRSGSDIQNWILSRNGWKSIVDLKAFLKTKKRVLDAGCGNGRAIALFDLAQGQEGTTRLVGCDLVAAEVAKENLKAIKNVEVFPADLTGDLSHLGKFDFIYSQEVLHHTANPEKSFANLVNCLEPNGEIAIYVYKKKAPVREFVDDFIRDRISNLPYDKAMEACAQITELGKTLSQIPGNITVNDLPVLGIKAGEYPVQRFIYHFFMKCFWNADISFEQNTAINFDWYHPQICERYELAEVEAWFERQNLKITHSFEDFYGITIHGKKQ
ncbi:MAG: class I SAM-dependent methyltransferase [Pseudobdellovibrio sp.]